MHKLEAYGRFVMELSPKPFLVLDPVSIRRTAECLMLNWAQAAAPAREVAVLLWVGDGSEILQWHGDMDESLPWAKHIGFCNYAEPGAYDPNVRHYRINQAKPYHRRAPVLRYRDLRVIIRALRAAARRILGKPLQMGATVDPGPEFAESEFRFRTHPEIMTPDLLSSMPMRFITHQATLRRDVQRYGAFPAGVPEGTSLGTFLGRQFQSLSRALDLDYLWLSNGFGYSHYPWGPRGELLRGRSFDGDRAEEQRRLTNRFWKDLREACPQARFEVRGTNFTVGMDLATDGCSHADIAAIGRLDRPPCNPPWGSRFLGLEIVSALSRIARTRTRQLPFRFYLNDPWFVANPWYDYYNREPYDLYVPMALSRINDAGGVDTPTDVSLLTVNTETGALPPDEAREFTPHLLRALAERADAPGPLVWVYPFDEYDAILKRRPGELRHLFHQDWFLCQAVNGGLPVGTVCSSNRIAPLVRRRRLPDVVYVAPVARGNSTAQRALLRHVRRGGQVLLYGALDRATPELLEALGVTLADQSLEGELAVELRMQGDRLEQAAPPPAADGLAVSVGVDGGARAAGSPAPARRPLRHRGEVDGGGLRAVVADWSDPDLRVIVRRGGTKRVYALSRSRCEWGGGRLTWIWGSTGFDNTDASTLDGRFDHPWDTRLSADWPRRLLADFGWDLVQERRDETVKQACLLIKRFQGAWYVVGHKPNTSVRFWLRAPQGAPVYAESETPIRDGYAGESFHKTIYNEVRAFVTMRDGVVTCKELACPHGKRRHLFIGGLRQADVTLYPDPRALNGGTLWVSSVIAGDHEVPYAVDKARQAVVVKGFTGDLYSAW